MKITQLAFYALIAITSGEITTLIISLIISEYTQLIASMIGIGVNLIIARTIFSSELKELVGSMQVILKNKKGA